VIAADRKNTLLDVPSISLAGGYEYTIIDTPGRLADITAAAITISDLCLIPICPSPYDLWATFDIVELLQTRHQLTNGRPEAAYVINRAVPATKISKSVKEYLETCAFPVIGEPIVQRVTYAESARLGMTIYDTHNDSAIKEMSLLGDAVVNMLGEVK
jgi:chromosome partitioning protein